MTVGIWQAEQGRRLAEVVEADPGVAACMPRPSVAAAVRTEPAALSRVVETIMHGYADRTALVQIGSATGDGEVSYRDAWRRARSVSTAWRRDAGGFLSPGDVVCSLGPAGVDYALLELAVIATGAVSVPLSAATPAAQWGSVLRETGAAVLAVDAALVEPTLRALAPEDVPPVVVVMGPGQPEDPGSRHRSRTLPGGAGTVEQYSLAALEERGGELAPAPLFVPEPGTEPLSQVIYTSGTTGDPKGAMFPEHLLAQMWRGAAQATLPAIVLHYMPLSHIAGRMVLVGTLARGGTCHFAQRGDMTSLLDDIAQARPTELFVIPRVCEMIRDRFTGDVLRRTAAGADRADAERAATQDVRERVLGGRVISAVNGSAPLGEDLAAFMHDVLGGPLHDGYGTTEAGGVLLLDNKIQRPPVIDFKLVDVPELGYFATDRPHPRGELLVRTRSMIPGYFDRPELNAEMFDADGFYRTGDVMARIGPEELSFVDRRNNVLKLSQAEFVTVSRVEDVLAGSPLVEQVFVYGRNGLGYLLAVVVPTGEAIRRHPEPEALRSALLQSIRATGAEAGLRSYEVPRDIVVEHEPFGPHNGLLSGVGKMLRPNLLERYRDRLEQLYTDHADRTDSEIAALHGGAAHRPVLATVTRAAAAVVGGAVAEPTPDLHFADLGGDSLSALAFSDLLREIFDVEIPVGSLVGPATDLRAVAALVEAALGSGPGGPTARSVHGADATTVRADDLALEAFLDDDVLGAAPPPGAAPAGPRTVLLTGANGYLGRFVALELLRSGDHVVCLVRGADAAQARLRMEAALQSGGPEPADLFRAMADRVRVVAGDVGEPRLGLAEREWRELTAIVDTVVHPAALVNHILPYEQLFGPNVRGTAEVARFALTARLKQVVYVSTAGVADQVDGVLDEERDLRVTNPVRSLDPGYASGYATSKWASEVLLRNAHDRCGLPVTVLRSTLLLAHRTFPGQLNLPDVFTRLLIGVLLTGLAPASFYRRGAQDVDGQPPAYDGVPVDFMAAVVARLGPGGGPGYRTLNAVDALGRGPSLDDVVDRLVEQGHRISRIDDYGEWLRRFEIGLRALPERLAGASALPLLDAFRVPADTAPPFRLSAERFTRAVDEAGLAGDGAVPVLSGSLVGKYVSDLRVLGLLPPGRSHDERPAATSHRPLGDRVMPATGHGRP